MLSVFLQTDQTRYWLDQTGVHYTLSESLESWHQSPHTRVALIEILQYDADTQDLIEFCCRHGHKVVLFMTEMITDNWCKQFDLDNVSLFVNGKLNWSTTQADVYECMYFFWSTCDFYRTFPALLEYKQVDIPKYFDVLLGRKKPHRDLVFDQIDHDSNIVTYFPTSADECINNYDEKSFIWPAIIDKDKFDVTFTVQEVTVNGVIVSLSQVIPQEIYQQTCYSLVAETQSENSWSFFTEKIVKPILARRLFLVVSGQHYLHNLRKMGFKTFGDIIDESYDQEPSLEIRINMIMQQVHYLQHQDFEQIKLQIQNTVDHNFKVMMDRHWQNELISNLKIVLD